MSPLELVSPLHFLQIECDRERLWCIRKTVAFCLTLISRRSEYFRGVWMSRRHCISSDLMPNASVIHQYTSVWHIKWYETHLQSIMFHSTMRQWTQWPRLWLIYCHSTLTPPPIIDTSLSSRLNCVRKSSAKWSLLNKLSEALSAAEHAAKRFFRSCSMPTLCYCCHFVLCRNLVHFSEHLFV